MVPWLDSVVQLGFIATRAAWRGRFVQQEFIWELGGALNSPLSYICKVRLFGSIVRVLFLKLFQGVPLGSEFRA